MADVARPATAGPDPARPVSLDLDLRSQVLRVVWADGAAAVYAGWALRRNCPCAGCRTAREQHARTLLPVLRSGGGEVRMTGGRPVGRYAVQVHWSDGHDTGIFDFRLLRSLYDARVEGTAPAESTATAEGAGPARGGTRPAGTTPGA